MFTVTYNGEPAGERAALDLQNALNQIVAAHTSIPEGKNDPLVDTTKLVYDIARVRGYARQIAGQLPDPQANVNAAQRSASERKR